MEIYNISFNTEEVVLLDDNDWENLSATFPNLNKARQAPYVYNYDTEKVLVKCNNIHNLFDIFDKKLWASKTNPIKNLTGWQMYVILNKTVALPKYKKNFGVKFTIVYVSNICEEVWAMQKIEAWNLIYNKIKDNMHNTVVEHHNV